MLRNTRYTKFIMGITLLVALVALTFGALWVTNAFGWRGFRLVDAEAFISAKLPAEARDVQFMTDDQDRRIVWLRFTLPAASTLDSFLADLNISAVLDEAFTPFPNPNYKEAGIPWWTPQAAQSYSGLYAITDNKVYEILVDTASDPSTIYLRVYGL